MAALDYLVGVRERTGVTAGAYGGRVAVVMNLTEYRVSN